VITHDGARGYDDWLLFTDELAHTTGVTGCVAWREKLADLRRARGFGGLMLCALGLRWAA